MGAGARCDDGGVGTTVLIVDDHADFRAFARALLEAGGFEVVGEAGDGASALATARTLKPALVLLDVQLPDVDGFAVCEQLTAAEGAPAVVLTSSRDASSYRRRLGESSARGFIAKTELSGAGLAALAGACRVRAALRLALVAAGLAARARGRVGLLPPTELGASLADLAVGGTLLGCGLVAWRGAGRAASGCCWRRRVSPGSSGASRRRPCTCIGGRSCTRCSRTPVGVCRAGWRRVVVVAAYIDGAIEPLGASPAVTLLLGAAIGVAAIDGYLAEVGPRRRARLVPTAGAAHLALVLGFGALGRLAGWGAEAATLWVYEACSSP